MIKSNESKEMFAKELFLEAFSDSIQFVNQFEMLAFSPERCEYAYDGDRVVSALYWFDCFFGEEKIAYIYGVSTAQSHRKQGYCKRLMEKTHERLLEGGYSGAILVPAKKELYSFYGNMGYVTCTGISEKTVFASDVRVDLFRLNKHEFASLRRKYLPENSVIEEGAALDLLSAYAEFYSGEDFVLVAERIDEGLRVTELLGNFEKAPQIIKSLGYSSATVRGVGEDKPFAMYYPLSDDKAFPFYFGLALD